MILNDFQSGMATNRSGDTRQPRKIFLHTASEFNLYPGMVPCVLIIRSEVTYISLSAVEVSFVRFGKSFLWVSDRHAKRRDRKSKKARVCVKIW